ncbi:hypothetical protein PMAC_002329 [Pneumocystis sp. 'macacae']|nr:hypothetical protein PMAC_002329 [Pneumocystis sp. 'macacae']
MDKNKKEHFTPSLNVSYEQFESYSDFGSLSIYSLQPTSSCQALPSSPSCDIKIRLSELSTYVPSKKIKLFRKILLLIQRKKNIFIFRNDLFSRFYISKLIWQTINMLCLSSVHKSDVSDSFDCYKKFLEEEYWRRIFLQEILMLTFFNQPIKQKQILSNTQSDLFNIIESTNNFVIKPSVSTCPMTPALQSSFSSITSASLSSTNYTLFASRLSPLFCCINQLSPDDSKYSPEKTSILYTGDDNLNSSASFSSDNYKLCLHDTYVNKDFSPKKQKMKIRVL